MVFNGYGLAIFSNVSKRSLGPRTLCFFRNYCQNSNDPTASNYESRLLAVLNKVGNWEPCK